MIVYSLCNRYVLHDAKSQPIDPTGLIQELSEIEVKVDFPVLEYVLLAVWSSEPRDLFLDLDEA